MAISALMNTARHAPRTESGRLARFLAVGASGTALDFALLTLLKQGLGMPTLPANTISFCVGILNNFTWNRLWTFADARDKAALTQFAQFFLVSITGLVLNNLLVLTLETPFNALLGGLFPGYLPAKLCATAIVVVWNFLANRWWTFRV